MTSPASLSPVFGWKEWVGLPALGLGAITAKVDTGARTSVLHAVDSELFGPLQRPRLRFIVHPLPSRLDLAVLCAAEVADRRVVTASNGGTELRHVVRTHVVVGALRREVELSLSDRQSLTFRMLLGREALRAFGALVDPSRAELGGARPGCVRPAFRREDGLG